MLYGAVTGTAVADSAPRAGRETAATHPQSFRRSRSRGAPAPGIMYITIIIIIIIVIIVIIIIIWAAHSFV